MRLFINSAIALVLSLVIIGCSSVRTKSVDDYLSMKFSEITAVTPEIQEYDFTMKFLQKDPVEGVIFSGQAVKASYSYINGDSIKWDNVTMSAISGFSEQITEGQRLAAFDGFSYKTGHDDFLSADFYKAIPLELHDWAMMLVTDAVQMHEMGLIVADSLEFGKAYYPAFMDNFDIEFEESGSFSSDRQKFTWSGLTKYNGEVCAVVDFESQFSMMNFETEHFSMKGRSMYYGVMYISLEDKQVEYSRMMEDVVRRMTPPGQIVNTQREVIFRKIN